MRDCIERVEDVVKGLGGKDEESNGISNVEEYVSNVKKEVIEMIKKLGCWVGSGLMGMFWGSSGGDGWGLCDGMCGRGNVLGRFVVGYDGSNEDYNRIGKMGGEGVVSVSLDEIGGDSDKIRFKEEKWGENGNNGGLGNDSRGEWGYRGDSEGSGGGSGDENRGGYLVVGYMIKV